MRLGILAAAIAAIVWAAPASASEVVNFTTVSDTDVANFGLGYLRGTGSGTLTVTGISGPISQAYLYWQGPTNTLSSTVNASASFAGSAITGTNIGFSSDNYWGLDNSQAYRADVTSLITGNGAYSLSGLQNSMAMVNGASLIVFYQDGNAYNNKDVTLFNGNDSNFNNAYDGDNWNAALNGLTYNGGQASLVLHVSDGQNFGPSDDGTLTINGDPIASGGIYEGGDGVQIGDGYPTSAALWDIKSFDITSSLKPGTNNLALQQDVVQDGLSLIVAEFVTPTAMAAAVPEPATWAMMLAGVALTGGALRRRKADRSGHTALA